MKKKLYATVIFLLFSMQYVFAQAEKADTVKRSHLLVKVDVLLPIAFLHSKYNDGYKMGFSLEYKTKTKLGYQLSYNFFIGKGSYDGTRGHQFIPEGRYYFNNHFVGLYAKLNYFKSSNPPTSIYHFMSLQNYGALGALYGYQKEFGRFNIEGRLGLGISKYYGYEGDLRKLGSYFITDDILWDVILAVNVGWKIF